MQPKNDLLEEFTALAKSVIYPKDNMEKFMSMLGTPEGAVIAVHTVLGAIEQAKHIPPQIAKRLGVNAYLIMVGMAQELTGKKADPGITKKVTGTILSEVHKTHGPQAASGARQPAPPTKRPMGIINGGMPA